MIFFRRIIKQLILTAVIGFVVRKLLSSNDPRAQRVGHGANRLVGGVFGLDERGHRVPRSRRVARSAGTAAVGGLMGYFFDPAQGADRRARAKTFASERLTRTRTPTQALPAATFEASPVGSAHAVGGSS